MRCECELRGRPHNKKKEEHGTTAEIDHDTHHRIVPISHHVRSQSITPEIIHTRVTATSCSVAMATATTVPESGGVSAMATGRGRFAPAGVLVGIAPTVASRSLFAFRITHGGTFAIIRGLQ